MLSAFSIYVIHWPKINHELRIHPFISHKLNTFVIFEYSGASHIQKSSYSEHLFNSKICLGDDKYSLC